MAGVEPASENTFQRTSTFIVCYLDFKKQTQTNMVSFFYLRKSFASSTGELESASTPSGVHPIPDVQQNRRTGYLKLGSHCIVIVVVSTFFRRLACLRRTRNAVQRTSKPVEANFTPKEDFECLEFAGFFIFPILYRERY